VDLFAGGICERRAVLGGHTGPLISRVIHRQIHDLRAADRFWYENILTEKEIEEVESYRLADVIINNTGLDPDEVEDNAFKVKR